MGLIEQVDNWVEGGLSKGELEVLANRQSRTIAKLHEKIAELQPLKKWKVTFHDMNMAEVSAHFVNSSGHYKYMQYEVSDAEYIFCVNKEDSFNIVARIPKAGVLSIVEVTG